MKVVIAGGTGQIGKILAQHFHDQGHQVVVLSRVPGRAPWTIVQWDGETLGGWASEVDGADVLINLAGRSVNCRYTSRNRCQIWSSRTRSTRVLGAAVRAAVTPPRVWLQASTATIYAHTFGAAHTEAEGVIGGTEAQLPDTWRFSIDVARAWEGEFSLLEVPGTRKVLLRSALTMSPSRGGVFDYLVSLARLGLGGRYGSGDQYVSWTHELDFIAAVEHIISNQGVSGPINICSPHPLPNGDFMRVLRRACSSRFSFPLQEWMIALGTWGMRTESELVLKSRRVVPGVLLESGFTFKYPEWESAATELCARWLRERN